MRPAFLADPRARRHVLQLADTLYDLARFFLTLEDELLRDRFWTVREVICTLVMDGARKDEVSLARVEADRMQLKNLLGENLLEPFRDSMREFVRLLNGALYRLISACTEDMYAHYLDFADDFIVAALHRKHKAGDRSVLPWLEGDSDLCPQEVRLGIKSAMQAASMIPTLKPKPEPAPLPVFNLPSPQDTARAGRHALLAVLDQPGADAVLKAKPSRTAPIQELRLAVELLRGEP